ncbi:MAG: hypothetical protein ABSD96_10980 [Candidatus Korobacteraceae bacterium]|jgi:hypothetical protein
MRLSRTIFASLALLLFCIAFLPSCGSSNNKVASITLTPSPVSLAYGQTAVLTATAVNSANAVVSAGFTFASSNASAVSIAPDGTLCGGTWDANFVTCSKPASSVPQTATITVTAQTVTQTVQAYVHEKVDSVVITGGPGVGSSGPICATNTKCVCTSLSLVSGSSASTSLPQFQAKAFSNDASVCTPKSLSAPCDITADLTAGNTTVSPFQWTTSDTTIATIDTTGTSTAGTVTPIGPGQASIFASTAGVNSPAVPFATCPVTSITLTATNAANSGLGALAISPGGTQALSAAVIDTSGATITYSTQNTTTLALNYPALSWLSTNHYAATAAAQTQTVKTTATGSGTNSNGTVGSVSTSQTVPLPTATATGVTNGVASLVTSCTPPSCNKNLFPVYSNPLVTTNAGITTATAFIASTQSLTMLALDVGSSTPLATYTLPAVPNSILFNKQGTKAVLGSSSGVFVFDTTVTTTTPFTTFPFDGAVLSISPDGSLAAVLGQVEGVNQNSIGIINLTQNALVATFPITGKPTDATQPSVAADFSVDSLYLWIAVTPSGSTTGRVYVYTSGVGSTFFAVSSAVKDLAFLASGPLVYLAGDTSTQSITARATCFGGQQNVVSVSTANGPDLTNGIVDVQKGTAPTNIRALPNGAGILALDTPDSIDGVTLTNPEVPLVGCPPSLPTTVSGSLESVAPQNLQLSLLLGSTTINQFLVTPDSSTAVLTSTGGNVVVVNLATLSTLTATSASLVPGTSGSSATLQDPVTNTLFKGDIPATGGVFIVGGSDGFLHEISFSAPPTDNVSATAVGLLQADGVTTALPNLVAIRNQ